MKQADYQAEAEREHAARMKAEAERDVMAAFVAGGMPKVIEMVQSMRAEIERLKNINQLLPTELLPPPRRALTFGDATQNDSGLVTLYEIGDNDEQLRQELINSGRPVWKWGQACMVGVTVFIRYDQSERIDLFKTVQLYPGTLDSIRRDIYPRIQALLARAPMREEFKQVGMIIKPEILEEAFGELATHLYHFQIPHLGENRGWSKKVGEVFDRLIWPNLTDAYEPDKPEKRKLFLKMVNRTFDNYERGIPSKKYRVKATSKRD